MAGHTKRWTRDELIGLLDDIWANYPARLAALPADEQARSARQQGYDRPQDLLAHLGAWMAETLRVMPYLQRDERPPRDYANDQQFNRRAVERLHDRDRAHVEVWYEKQRRTLRKLVKQLPEDGWAIARVYRWLSDTIVGHYAEHPLPDNALE
ncbi:MAG TPA: ClbS/DfsB family four-helix bundle protein [Anaerolineae bacterium]|nr:ClbS/DfsB family four-helix bundle protein [Anaerolineae bacterium]